MKLINYLNEITIGKYAPLYHSTSYTSFLSIMNDGEIKHNKFGNVFLSRDKNYKVLGNETPIIFIINQEKIKQKLKIYQRVGDIVNKDKRIEAEEVVKGSIPLKWVDKILVPSNIIKDIEKSKKQSINGITWSLKQIEISNERRIKQLQKGIETRKKDIKLYDTILSYNKIVKI